MKSHYFSKHRLLSTSDVTMHNVPCGVSEKAESSWVYSLKGLWYLFLVLL